MRYKKIIYFAIIGLVMLAVSTAYAHNGTEHSKQLEKVLFGRDNYYAAQPEKQKLAIKALESAAFLCPDQYNGDGSEELQTLHDYGVPNLPASIDEINFTSNYSHRKYTHLGWVPAQHPDRGNWDKRKELLLSTANTVFDFGWTSGASIFGWQPFGYSEQCDAFCALVYYVHILGDVEDLQTYEAYRKEGSYVYPLVRSDPSANNPDILYDLMEIYLPKLFPNQSSSSNYENLYSKLKPIAGDARKITSSEGGINSEEKYAKYRKYTLQTIDVLSEYIPTLLMNESFFSNVFGGL